MLSSDFCKDLSCYHGLTACSLFIMNSIWTCALRAAEPFASQGLHGKFPFINARHPVCYLETLNAVVAIKMFVQWHKDQFFHLFCDSATAVAIFQAGRERNTFLQACARELWLTCGI